MEQQLFKSRERSLNEAVNKAPKIETGKTSGRSPAKLQEVRAKAPMGNGHQRLRDWMTFMLAMWERRSSRQIVDRT
jgi:hypothetical protein